MQPEMFGFWWPVAEAGYVISKETVREVNRWASTAERLTEDNVNDAVVIVARDLSDRRERWYAPLASEPGLFRTFAELPDDPDTEEFGSEILAFANQYGLLGGGAAVQLVDRRPGMHFGDDLGGQIIWTGWLIQIWSMKRLVSLWDLITSRDIEALGNMIRISSEGKAQFEIVDQTLSLSDPTGKPRSQDVPCDILYFATAALHQLANQYMQGGPRWGVTLHPRLFLTHDRGDGAPRMDEHYIPDSLLSALWLQFVQAVGGNKRYTKCQAPGCGRWIELAPGSNRSDKLYCSDACRMRAYRHRTAVRKRESLAAPVDGAREGD